MQDRTHELILLLLKLVGMALSPAWAWSISPILFWYLVVIELALAAALVIWFCRLPWSRRHAAVAIPAGLGLSLCLVAALNAGTNLLAFALYYLLHKHT
jgi:hypothetical protein